MKNSFVKTVSVGSIVLGIVAIGVAKFAPALALFVFELLAAFGLWAGALVGIVVVVLLVNNYDRELSVGALTVGGIGVLALGLGALFIVPSADYDISRELVSIERVNGIIPTVNPISVRDMNKGKVGPIFTRFPEAEPNYLDESEPIPAFTQKGEKLWVLQQVPNKLAGKLKSNISHFLVQEAPGTKENGKIQEIMTTTHSTFGGWQSSNTHFLLQREHPTWKFMLEDQKYIEVEGVWKLAIPYQRLQWHGLQNSFQDKGVVLIDGKGIEYVENSENRPELEIYPLASSDQINRLVRGLNYKGVSSFYSLIVENVNEIEEVLLTSFKNREQNFQFANDPKSSGFVTSFEPLGSSTKITSTVLIKGFTPGKIKVFANSNTFTPDGIAAKLEGMMVQKYNTVFGANSASSFTRQEWTQVQIGDKSWMVALLVNSANPELYKGIIAFHTSQATPDLDNPKSFVFIKASEDGTMSDKLTQFLSGKEITSDFYIGSGVVNNPPQTQLTPQDNKNNVELLKLLQEIQKEQRANTEELKALRQELKNRK